MKHIYLLVLCVFLRILYISRCLSFIFLHRIFTLLLLLLPLVVYFFLFFYESVGGRLYVCMCKIPFEREKCVVLSLSITWDRTYPASDFSHYEQKRSHSNNVLCIISHNLQRDYVYIPQVWVELFLVHSCMYLYIAYWNVFDYYLENDLKKKPFALFMIL